MNLLFIVLDEMLTSVVPSQVITPAKVFTTAMRGVRTRIIFLEPARVAFSRRGRERLRELRRVWPGANISICPYVGRMGRLSPSRFLQAYLRATGVNGKNPVFHCRGPEAALHAAHLAKRFGGRVVFDARGASDYEAVLRLTAQGRGDNTELLMRALREGAEKDKRAVQESDAVIAVGRPLAQKLSGALEEEQKIVSVVPCCIERPFFSHAARREMRSRLGIADDELLLVHVSSEAQWEDFRHILAFFRAVRERRKARMIFITQLDASVITSNPAADDSIRESLIITSVEFSEMPRYLSAADVGLLLRKPHDTFRMATPIKLAEYLGAGLAVVVSEGIGDAARTVESRKIGVGIPADACEEAIEASARRLVSMVEGGVERVRQAALETCRELFLWERYVPFIARAYGCDIDGFHPGLEYEELQRASSEETFGRN